MDFTNPNVAFNPLPWLSLTSFASPTAPSTVPSAVDADFYARAFLGGADPTSTTTTTATQIPGTISPDALFGALPQDMSSSSSSTGSERYGFGDEFVAGRQRGSNASSFSSSTSSFLFPSNNNDSSSHRSTRPSTPEDSSPYQPSTTSKTKSPPSITITRPSVGKRLRSSAAIANAAIVATAREEEGDEVKEKTPAGKKKRRPRKMTEKRREQNRLAQKNLRARRAAQYSEYHDRVDVLEKENQELRTLIEALRDENSALRSPNAANLSVPRTSSLSASSVTIPSSLLLDHLHRNMDTDFTATSASEVEFESDFEHGGEGAGSPF